MRPSVCCGRIVDVLEKPERFTELIRPFAPPLVDRYSEREEAGLNRLVDDHAAAAIGKGELAASRQLGSQHIAGGQAAS